MAIGFITGFILLVAAIGLFIGTYKCYENDHSAGGAICLMLAIICCLSFIIVPFSFHTVQSGELAVVKTLGKITGTREAGTNFDIWITNSYQRYDTKVQNVEITTSAYSSDAQTMDINMTLQYQVIPDKIVNIATQYGTLEVLEGRIQSIVIEKTKAVLSSHKAMDIIANRATISPEVEAAIRQAVGSEYYVSITTVVLTNIDFSDAFEKAVEDKMIAEQTKLKADYENQTKVAQAAAEAEARLKSAEAEVEIAKAKAEALMIAAEAEAEANKLLAASLSDEVLESKFYDKWDGQLPQVMGEGSAILDIRDKDKE
jgi:regulator of protease activity HflC (stomatin/prohibitin superfamily)